MNRRRSGWGPGRALVVTALGSVAGVLAGCGVEAAPTGPVADLVGRDFVSEEVTGPQVPGGGPVSLSFPDPESITGSAGCNTLFAAVDLADGVLRPTSGIGGTEKGCIDSAGADEWFVELLEAEPSWSLAGDTLTLTTDASTVVLTDLDVIDPDRPLAGTRWRVVDQRTGSGPDGQVHTSTDLEEAAAELTVDEGGEVTAHTGCRTQTGRAEVTADTIEVAEWAARAEDPSCPAGIAEVDAFVTDVLQRPMEYAIEHSRLVISSADGERGLGLTAVD